MITEEEEESKDNIDREKDMHWEKWTEETEEWRDKLRTNVGQRLILTCIYEGGIVEVPIVLSWILLIFMNFMHYYEDLKGMIFSS